MCPWHQCDWWRASVFNRNRPLFLLDVSSPTYTYPPLTWVRFLSFGVGLDPRQQKVFGPKFGPFLVGCVLGLISFSSIGLGAGFPGAGLNPARCFSTAVARGDFTRELEPFRSPVLALILVRSMDLVGWSFDGRLGFYCCVLYRPAIPSRDSDRKRTLSCSLSYARSWSSLFTTKF